MDGYLLIFRTLLSSPGGLVAKQKAALWNMWIN